MTYDLMKKYTKKQFAKLYWKQYPGGNKKAMEWNWQNYLLMRCSDAR